MGVTTALMFHCCGCAESVAGEWMLGSALLLPPPLTPVKLSTRGLLQNPDHPFILQVWINQDGKKAKVSRLRVAGTFSKQDGLPLGCSEQTTVSWNNLQGL
jgi:hypothetical protein